ncbi:MAG: hypothetical protein JO133_14595 [Burkholderiaceae bacterium]|nr:hypothetical protein [Burkholderiaceae bacterium]
MNEIAARANRAGAAHSAPALPRTGLGRKIGWALALKLCALTALWLLFFAPWHRPRIGSDEAGAHLTQETR